MLHYSNKVAWTRSEDYDVVGVSGFGITYLFSGSAPSAFLTGAVGVGVAGSIESSDLTTGVGFSIGGGVEFARHWLLDAEILFIRLQDEPNHRVLKGGISWVFY
jgi:hypothetical protein